MLGTGCGASAGAVYTFNHGVISLVSRMFSLASILSIDCDSLIPFLACPLVLGETLGGLCPMVTTIKKVRGQDSSSTEMTISADTWHFLPAEACANTTTLNLPYNTLD